MNFLMLLGVEYKKIRHSFIVYILAAGAVILWVPSIFNAHLNFKMQDIGITPENNFLIQGFMGMAWFMFPAVMIACTVLLIQTERGGRGIIKMLSLPVDTKALCLAKFIVLTSLAALQILLTTGMYYLSAAAASHTQDYDFMLDPVFVFKEAGLVFLTAIPMLAVFWLIGVCIQTPVFSIGAGLVLIVPSVLVINTKVWFLYPMAYPFYMVSSEYSRLAEHMTANEIRIVPWLISAVCITAFCLAVSCICFGRAQRKPHV